jgi:hypothetical protein
MKFPLTTLAETFLASICGDEIALEVWVAYQLLNPGSDEACAYPPVYWIVEDRNGKQYRVINHDTFEAADGSIAKRFTTCESS